MNTRNAANRVPRRLAINRDAPVAAVLDRILTAVKPYREFIVLIGVLAGVGVGIVEHFITRSEVRVLNCRSLAKIELLENRMEKESLKLRVARALVLLPPPLTKAPLQGLTTQEQAAVADYIEVQGSVLLDLSASNAIAAANARLKAGKCEELVKLNKDT